MSDDIELVVKSRAEQRFVFDVPRGGIWLLGRPLAHFAQGDELAKFSKSERSYGEHILDVDEQHPANSWLSGRRWQGADEPHLPMLDDDEQLFHVVRSRNGRQHVYIDKPIRWVDYCALLELLAHLQLIDARHAELSIQQGATTLRLPR